MDATPELKRWKQEDWEFICWLPSEFKASLRYMRSCVKKKKTSWGLLKYWIDTLSVLNQPLLLTYAAASSCKLLYSEDKHRKQLEVLKCLRYGTFSICFVLFLREAYDGLELVTLLLLPPENNTSSNREYNSLELLCWTCKAMEYKQ